MEDSRRRKKVVLTIKQKLELIDRFEKGEPAAKLAKHYGIGLQTVRDIRRSKARLQDFLARYDAAHSSSSRKSMKESSFRAELDVALLRWLNGKRAAGEVVTGPMLAKQAKEIHASLGLEGDFSASRGWLSRFKDRYGIRDLSGMEHIHIPEAELPQTIFDLLSDVRDVLPLQIYSTKETELYWKALPRRNVLTLPSSDVDAGCRRCEERMTVMCCSNVTGCHKLKLLVVAKDPEPHSLEGSESSSLPVRYYSHQSAQISADIFEHWFNNEFVPQVQTLLLKKGMSPRAILICKHSYGTELSSLDGLVVTKVLRVSSKAVAGQSVVTSMKRLYRADLLNTLVEEDAQLMSFWKQLSLVDAIYRISQAWDCVQQMTILKSWETFIPELHVEEEDHEDHSAKDIDTQQLVSRLRCVQGCQDIGVDDLDEWLENDDTDPGFEPGLIERSDETSGRVSHSAALVCLDTVLDYMRQQAFEYSDIVTVRKVRSLVRRNLKGKP